MPLATPMSKPGFWPRATSVTLFLWGLLHIVGGGALMALGASDPAAGLKSLGSAKALPPDPGEVVGALIGFHGLNLAFAGVAVTALAVWAWRSWPRGVPTGVAIATAADIGLIFYLLGPGHMKITDGLWGPLLLVLAALGWALSSTQPETTSQPLVSHQRAPERKKP